MDLESLHTRLPDAQQEVINHREFDAELLSLDNPVLALERGIRRVNDTLGLIVREFGDQVSVRLSTVEAVGITDEEGESKEQPGGILNAKVSKVTRYMLTQRSDGRGDSDEVLGHKLSFFFTPFKSAKSEEVDDSRAVLIVEESTIYPQSIVGEKRLSEEELAGVVNHRHFVYAYRTSVDLEKLRYYADNYLAQRSAQIEAIEQSTLWIKDALENPELNPWVGEKRTHARELAKAQERDQHDIAMQIEEEYRAPQTPGRRTRFSRR